MTKKMRLQCTIQPSETVGMWVVSSVMYEGTPFSLKVQTHHVVPNEPVEEGRIVDGFLYVEQIGQQHQRVAIVLPAAAYTYGTNVTVNALQLQPYMTDISMFGGKHVPYVVIDEPAEPEPGEPEVPIVEETEPEAPITPIEVETEPVVEEEVQPE